MRIKIKKPLTPRSEQMILNSLEKLGKTEEEKIALLEQSTLKCRLDIYPLKEPLPTADTDKAKLKEDYDKFKKRKDGQSFI